MRSISFTAIEGIPMVSAGDDLAALIAAGIARTGAGLQDGDILVVCQKVVSKAEGRIVNLEEVEPSEFAMNLARRWEKDPRAVEVVLRNSNRIVRNDRGVIIVETGPGWTCANAGVDESNSPGDAHAILLPEDSDASARKLRDAMRESSGANIAVIITDTFGRPWRDGLTEVCLGIAGMNPMLDLRGSTDLNGRELHHSVIAVADEIAAGAGLLMEKAGAVPAVIVRGYKFEPREASATVLIRPAEADLFR
ncbi:MAG TPA: coenzyme F420-0:L-glutamate ligase [Candidatus Binataceae bacterium]|nr:coenzyme F420-0:L-glutamate ligase [Candidatus Binataceae bacterium]